MSDVAVHRIHPRMVQVNLYINALMCKYVACVAKQWIATRMIVRVYDDHSIRYAEESLSVSSLRTLVWRSEYIRHQDDVKFMLTIHFHF